MRCLKAAKNNCLIILLGLAMSLLYSQTGCRPRTQILNSANELSTQEQEQREWAKPPADVRAEQQELLRVAILTDDATKIRKLIDAGVPYTQHNSPELRLALENQRSHAARALLELECDLPQPLFRRLFRMQLTQTDGLEFYKWLEPRLDSPLTKEEFGTLVVHLTTHEKSDQLNAWLQHLSQQPIELKVEWEKGITQHARSGLKFSEANKEALGYLSPEARTEIYVGFTLNRTDTTTIGASGPIVLSMLPPEILQRELESKSNVVALSNMTPDMRLDLWWRELDQAMRDFKKIPKLERWLPYLEEVGPLPRPASSNNPPMSAVEYVSQKGNLPLLRWLLEQELYGRYPTQKPSAKVMMALAYGDLKAVRETLDPRRRHTPSLASVWFEVEEHRPYSPLLDAIEKKDWNTIDLLLSLGADLQHVHDAGVVVTDSRLIELAAKYGQLGANGADLADYFEAPSDWPEQLQANLIRQVPAALNLSLETSDFGTLHRSLDFFWFKFAENSTVNGGDIAEPPLFEDAFRILTGQSFDSAPITLAAVESPAMLARLQLAGLTFDETHFHAALEAGSVEALRILSRDHAYRSEHSKLLQRTCESFLQEEADHESDALAESEIARFIQEFRQQLKQESQEHFADQVRERAPSSPEWDAELRFDSDDGGLKGE